jgi:pimeloyl-ACP methyl ester carboxylesterase
MLTRRGFTTSMLATPLGRVHVLDAPGRGTLPTTVLLHGLSSVAVLFAPILASLRERTRRVVAIDYPGHGFSDEPLSTLTPSALFESTRAAIDAVLGDEQAVLVGNSLGGAVAVDYAANRARRVRALVLLSPAGAACAEDEWTALRERFAVTSRRGAVEFIERLHHRAPAYTRLFAHELPAAMQRRAVRELLATATNDAAVTPEELASLSMPILFWWGRSERLLPPSHLAWWRAHLPAHAVLEEPEGIGHCPHLDAPRRVTRRLMSFLDTLA